MVDSVYIKGGKVAADNDLILLARAMEVAKALCFLNTKTEMHMKMTEIAMEINVTIVLYGILDLLNRGESSKGSAIVLLTSQSSFAADTILSRSRRWL